MSGCDHEWGIPDSTPGGSLFSLRYTCWKCRRVEDRDSEGDETIITACPPGTVTSITEAIDWRNECPENALEAEYLRTVGRLGPSAVGVVPHPLEDFGRWWAFNEGLRLGAAQARKRA